MARTRPRTLSSDNVSIAGEGPASLNLSVTVERACWKLIVIVPAGRLFLSAGWKMSGAGAVAMGRLTAPSGTSRHFAAPDGLVAFGACRDHHNFDSHLVGQEFQIVLGLRREPGKVPQPECGLLPPGHLVVADFHLFENVNLGRKIGNGFALVLVFHTHGNLSEVIEDVQLGDDQ